MPDKPEWPMVATLMPDNTCKHSYILGIYIDTTFAFMLEGYKPPIKTFKAFLQATLTFITKTKQKSNNLTILKEIQKVADASLQCKFYIKEQITAIKNASAIGKKSFLYSNYIVKCNYARNLLSIYRKRSLYQLV